MTYALIGSGNMAWLVASRMLAAGHTCAGAWGRNSAELAAMCSAFSLPQLLALSNLNDGADAVIIAVSDNAIAEVAKQIKLRHSTLIHTGGAVPLGVLDGYSLSTGVVWPIYSIRKAAMPPHRSFPALIEGNSKNALAIVRMVAKAICDTSYEADSEQRAWMHLAAVIGNNFVNHLLSIAAEISATKGMPMSLLQPLIEQSVANFRTQHPAEAQTGPARRGDLATMQQHIEMLSSQQPQWQQVYEAISASIMNQYKPIKG